MGCLLLLPRHITRYDGGLCDTHTTVVIVTRRMMAERNQYQNSALAKRTPIDKLRKMVTEKCGVGHGMTDQVNATEKDEVKSNRKLNVRLVYTGVFR